MYKKFHPPFLRKNTQFSGHGNGCHRTASVSWTWEYFPNIKSIAIGLGHRKITSIIGFTITSRNNSRRRPRSNSRRPQSSSNSYFCWNYNSSRTSRDITFNFDKCCCIGNFSLFISKGPLKRNSWLTISCRLLSNFQLAVISYFSFFTGCHF